MNFKPIYEAPLITIGSLIVVYLLTPMGKVKYKLARNPYNPVVLLISISLIIVCSISLSRWLFIYTTFTQVQNYLYLTIISLTISITFSAIEWIICIVDPTSFLVQNQYLEILRVKTLVKGKNLVDSYRKRLGILNSNLTLFNDGTAITEKLVGSNIAPDPNVRRALLKYDHNIESPLAYIDYIVFKMSVTGLYFVTCSVTRGAGHMVSVSEVNYLINNDDVYYFAEAHTFGKVYDDNNRNLNSVIQLMEKEIGSINKKISYENDFEDGETMIPISDFIFNNMFELFSIRQGYFMPTSTLTKTIHFLFGIYKYLFLGTLVTLVIKR